MQKIFFFTSVFFLCILSVAYAIPTGEGREEFPLGSDDTDDFDVGAGKFVVEGNTGNVGIGDASPASLFTVGSTDPFQVNSSGDIVKIKNLTYSWPSTRSGTQYLSDNGSGTLSWVSWADITSVKLSGLTAADTTNSIASADNAQIWNWQVTTNDKSAITLGETTASTGTDSGTTNRPSILKATTLASSTAIPLFVENKGDGASLRVDDVVDDTSPFLIDLAGNVGIGTTAPDENLHVSASTGGFGAHIGNAYVGVWDPNSAYAVFVHNDIKTTTGSYAIIQDSTGNTFLNAASTKEIGFSINNSSNKMTLNNIGNLGIGDLTPAALLSVGSGDLFVVTSAGNVGIGDTSPDSLLDLHSAVAVNLLLTSTGTDTDVAVGLALAEGTNNFTVGVDDSDLDKFKISTTALGTSDRFTIDSAGNVGVGIASGTAINALLTVNGGLAIPDSGSITSITADNQAVTVGNRSYLRLDSNDGLSTNRNFTIGNGTNVGQALVLEWADAAGDEGELADSGNCSLTTFWPAGISQQDDILLLIWNGTVWLEIFRQGN